MKRKFLWIPAAALAVILLSVSLLAKNKMPAASHPTEATAPFPTVAVTDRRSDDLGHGLYVTQVGSYTGPFVEDGSDDMVSGVLMLKVANRGQNPIEYGVITLPVAQGQASFTLSALLPGQTVVLLEQNRLPWSSSEPYLYPTLSDTAYYSRPLDRMEKLVSLQLLEGGINVTNISDEDISGDIVIYYKNKQQDLYYGGITYRLRISSGLPSGASCQLISQHLHKNGTEILFVTVD